MEKMMKKPEVEAVRFDDADVIATSSLVQGKSYVTKGVELNQAHTGDTSYDSSSYYNIDSLGNSTGHTDENSTDPYAWYNSNTSSWGTYGWTINQHGESNLPTGED